MDALTPLSLLGLLFSFVLGFSFKNRYAWFLMWTMPILASGRVILVPSTVFPLDYYQISFAGVMGILFKQRMTLKTIRCLFHDSLFIFITIFTIHRIIISESSRYPYLFFGWIPQILLAFMLARIVVNDSSDLKKIMRIYAFQGAFIGFFIIVGYLTDFSLEELFRSTIPGYDVDKVSAFVRAYNVRVNGIDGSAVLTAARLIVLLFIAMFHYYATKGKLNLTYVVLIISGTILLQTRAAFVALVPSFLLFLGVFMSFPSVERKQILLKNIPLLLLGSVALSFFSVVIAGFFPMLIRSVTDPFNSSSVLVKIERIPIAMQYFLSKPFTGHGSANYVYYQLMNTQDLPAPIIYLVAGGVFLFFSYVMILILMPLNLFRIYLRTKETSILFITLGVCAGVIMPLSNWIETHYVIMIILYSAVRKIYSKPCP